MSNSKTFFLYIFQPFAHYRNPFTWNHPRTLPLPPRSTVVGMLQRLTGDYYGSKKYHEEWRNLEIMILGRFSTKFNNYSRLYKGDEFWFSKTMRLIAHSRKGWKIINGPSGFSADPNPQYIEELFNQRLLIFLRGNEGLIGEIHETLKSGKFPNLYLGRAEDIAFIRGFGYLNEVKAQITEIIGIGKRYGYWILDKNELLEQIRKGFTYFLPIHSEFRIESENRPPKNRSELFYRRKSLVRFNVWEKHIYIPPGVSVGNLSGVNIYQMENLEIKDPIKEEIKQYFGTLTFRMPEEAWLRGEEHENG